MVQFAPPHFDPAGIVAPPLREGEWPVSSIALDVSGRCNIACRYCAESATQPTRQPMDESTLVAALELISSPEGPEERSIHIGSGEPTLAMPLLHRLAELVNQMVDPRLQVHLTTNGTLLSREVREWLVENDWNVKISLDGPKAIQDRWRVTRSGNGTYDRIHQSVTDLAERMPGSKFSVTAVLCRGSDPEEVFDGIALLGVQNILLIPVYNVDPSFLPNRVDIQNYQRFIMDYANRFLGDETWQEIPTLIQFKKFVYRVMGYFLDSIPCGASRSYIGIDPDGGIYPCFRFIGIEGYKIGQLQSGIDKQAAKQFQEGAGRPLMQRTKCQQCWAAPVCGGPCFAGVEMFSDKEWQPLDLQCEYVRADVTAASWLVHQLRENYPERLLNFFPEQVINEIESIE